jgi:hypothetical protein
MDIHKMNVQFDESANRVDAPPDRSRSRGREVVCALSMLLNYILIKNIQKSSGRGGAGNIRSSVERDSRTYIDSVPVRDREHSPLPGVRSHPLVAIPRPHNFTHLGSDIHRSWRSR